MRAVGRHGCGTQFHSVRLHACRPKEGGRVLGPDPSYSGSFVEAVLAHPEVARSSHPTNSFAAIGTSADLVNRFHCQRRLKTGHFRRWKSEQS